MNFDEELRKRRDRANDIIEGYLPGEDAVPGKLAEAMNYSIRIGGKRIRPILMMESYRMFGGHGTAVEPFMAAIEMIHTHSLVHDDLPAIDNDALRRGRKTTHAVYGEAIGILAGDALLNYAYETALQAFRHTEDPQRVVRALEILSSETGLYGMLGGQSVDVENDKNGVSALSKESLDYIYFHKTGALIEAPLMIGAALAGADKTETGCMKEIGSRIGLAFQIQDDILDVTGTTEELGKPVGSDTKNDKTTYVTLRGLDGARKTVKEQTDAAVRLLDSMLGEKEFLRELLIRMASRSK
ncbi:MAG: polyprenyl synthetase family protein [Bilifractor sp.]